MSRKLVTVRKVSEIKPIEGADRIEVAVVDGWEVVVAKSDGWKAGDLGLYFEIDSWIPNNIAPFLTKEGKEPRSYKGIKGERLRTVKLRKQISQGLLLPLNKVPVAKSAKLGDDYTEKLGIVKYEIFEEFAATGGFNTRLFPTDLFPKTDQERIQNCFNTRPHDHTWEKTLKLDGSSCTIFKHKGELRVCSRNLRIRDKKSFWQKVVDFALRRPKKKSNVDNNFVRMALQVEGKLKDVDDLAFQGELMGPGIQKNREGFEGLRWFVYDIVDIKTRAYLTPNERRVMLALLGLEGVPVVDIAASMPVSVAAALEEASNAPSINHPVAEGFVYKSNKDPSLSFKVISNKYLLAEE